MTFLQVKYFLAVVKSSSISRAADELFVSRSAISRTLRELEEEYGLPLLERTISGVKPTAAGQLVYDRFLEIQHKNVLLDNCITDLRRQLTRKNERVVKLCITPVTALSLFPLLRRRVHERFPDIEILTSEADSLQAANMLADGTLDFRLTADGRPDTEADAGHLRFRCCEYALCMAPDNPLAARESLTVDDIVSEPIIFFDQHDRYQSSLELMFREKGLTPNIAMRSFQLAAVREAVRRGYGCTPMPRGTLDDGETIVSVPIRPAQRRCTELMWNPDVRHNTAFADFLNAAQEQQRLMAQEAGA